MEPMANKNLKTKLEANFIKQQIDMHYLKINNLL